MKIISDINIKTESIIRHTRYMTGVDLIDVLDAIIRRQKIRASAFLVLTDKTIFALYGKKITESLARLNKKIFFSVINSGERQKDITKIPHIIQPFFKKGFDRQTCLISIGGGVVTDIGGFISAILMRGITSIFIPTTLLAQIDASIGGKNGVDLFINKDGMIKNMLGTIQPPDLVISDISFLKTLPVSEIVSGLGEMVKYHTGWKKPTGIELTNFKELIKNNNWERAAVIINKCQKIKLDIVELDPYEQLGLRRKLNLGHTIGHALEAVANGKLTHGQAVSIGLIAVAKISFLKGLLDKDKLLKIQTIILQLGLPVSVSNIDKKDVSDALKFDKKGGSFILFRDLGKIIDNIPVEQNIINKVLNQVIV